jgi:mTERF domain-containing protein
MNFLKNFKRFYSVKTNQKLVIIIKNQSTSKHILMINFQVESIAKLPAISNCSHEQIEEFLESTPELQSYPPELWQRSYETIVNEGFSPTKFLSIVNLNPKLLYSSPIKVHDQIEKWRSYQFGEKVTIELLETHQHLLEFTNFVDLTRNLEFLKTFVKNQKNLAKVLLNNPNLVFDKLSTIEGKVNYFRDIMKVDHTEVVKSSAFSLDLDKIKTRHIFMERLGLYETKRKKADENEPSTNPKFYQMMDTSDKRFATKLCFVTLEEYEAFEMLLKKELAKTDEDSDDELD